MRRSAGNLFRKIHAQRLLLEYDDARSGSFEPLKDIAEDKFVVLGLVTTKKADLEATELLTRRIAEARHYFADGTIGAEPPVRLCLFRNR